MFIIQLFKIKNNSKNPISGISYGMADPDKVFLSEPEIFIADNLPCMLSFVCWSSMRVQFHAA